MYKGIRLLGLIQAALLSFACTTAGLPTGPSMVNMNLLTPPTAAFTRNFPTLVGQWHVSGTTAFRNVATGNTLNWGGCAGSFTVSDQQDQRFTGQLGTRGGGFNSDRFCTAMGTFNGELVERDGSVARARLEGNFQNWPRPAVSPSCEIVSAGEGIWLGSATDDAMRLEVRDTLRCPANVDGGIAGIPMADFERTVSLTFER